MTLQLIFFGLASLFNLIGLFSAWNEGEILPWVPLGMMFTALGVIT